MIAIRFHQMKTQNAGKIIWSFITTEWSKVFSILLKYQSMLVFGIHDT